MEKNEHIEQYNEYVALANKYIENRRGFKALDMIVLADVARDDLYRKFPNHPELPMMASTISYLRRKLKEI